MRRTLSLEATVPYPDWFVIKEHNISCTIAETMHDISIVSVSDVYEIFSGSVTSAVVVGRRASIYSGIVEYAVNPIPAPNPLASTRVGVTALIPTTRFSQNKFAISLSATVSTKQVIRLIIAL